MFLPPYFSLKKDPHRIKNVKENRVQKHLGMHSLTLRLNTRYTLQLISYLFTFKKESIYLAH